MDVVTSTFRRTLRPLAALAGAALLLGAGAPPPDSSLRVRAADPEAAALARLTEPGPQHQRLTALAGHWNSVHRVTPEPGATPIEIPSRAEYKSILGGRFVAAESELDFGGEKGQGLAIYGYDRFKNRYSFFFAQDHDTQVLSGLGEADAGGKRVTFDVAMDLPASGERARHYRTVLTFEGPDRHTFEMWATLPDGREWCPLHIEYTRSQ